MADLVITGGSVLVSANARVNTGTNAGEAVTAAGSPVYLKSTTSTWFLMQNDGTAEESGFGVTKGIALHPAAVGQPLAVLEAGDITIGATVAAGVEYYASAAAGAIADAAPATGGTKYLTVIGYGISTTVIRLLMHASGVLKT